MPPSPRFFVTAALFLIQTLAAAALETPQAWLQAMSEAMQHRNYRATVVYGRDNRLQTLVLVHMVKDGKVYERLQALDAPQRTVIREGGEVQCYFPKRRVLIVENRQVPRSLFGNALPSHWDQLVRYYRFQLGPQGQVAGRRVQTLVIEPLDSARYGRRLWIDVETKLPLRFELVDAAGNVLESFVVVSLETGAAVRSDTGPVPARDADWRVIDHREAAADGRWRLGWLPPGFKEVRRMRRVDPEDGSPVDHLLISDGLANVSVYIRPADGDAFAVGKLRLGAVNVYNRRLGDYWVTVLGDVPPDTVKRIAEGVTDTAS